jgi:hypothetical protein
MDARSPLYNAKYWRDRAEETRAKAESVFRQDSKDRLLKIADEYERLALHAEQWQTPETKDQTPQLSSRLNDSPSRSPAADSN